MFSVNAVFPIILTVLLGYVLKRIGTISHELAAGLNRLVFRIFLPAMLFVNVYSIESISDIDLGYAIYASLFTLAIFLVGIPLVCIVSKKPEQRGPMLQATFRSNFALIGIPLATSLFGAEGGIVASVLSAFIVPVYNALAVISLSIFGNREKKISFLRILVGILLNPLIQAIALGSLCLLIRMLFSELSISFRLTDLEFLYKAIETLSSVATPLALIALGAQFEISAIASLKKPIIFVTLMRAAVIPAFGLGIAYFMGCFSPAHFAAFIAVFVSPVSISSVPMSQEMGADSALAGQLVVFTTLASAFSLFIAACILRILGIF